jgi:Resolvase, N terminal domain
MGRLTLNILLSFAQFEREIISERTRDKIAAARRKGKWSGGMPLLGYDIDPNGSKLIVDPVEATRRKKQSPQRPRLGNAEHPHFAFPTRTLGWLGSLVERFFCHDPLHCRAS